MPLIFSKQTDQINALNRLKKSIQRFQRENEHESLELELDLDPVLTQIENKISEIDKLEEHTGLYYYKDFDRKPRK